MRNVLVCCVILTITICASCLQITTERRCNKRLMKRDASLLVDTSPIDIEPVYKFHPAIAFRRLSRTRQKPRPRQSPRVHKKTKKYRKPTKPTKPKRPSDYYKKSVTPQYNRKRVVAKSKYYQRPSKYLAHYPTYNHNGYGEPPADLKSYSKNEYKTREQPQFIDELIDSYGEPIKSSNLEYPPIGPTQFNSAHQPWQEHEDNAYAHARKRPDFKRPDPQNIPEIEDDEDAELDKIRYYYWLQEKPSFTMGQNKFVRTPWKISSERARESNEVLVGGQYAEPPARYVPKFQPSAPMLDDDEEFSPPRRVKHEFTSSENISPYVNYKNSNMAFSPQNLNDAFSIVEK